MISETVEWFDHPGLFMVAVDQRAATRATQEVPTVSVGPRPGRARAEPSRWRAEGVRHRYCSGCSRETGHVPRELASDTTICADCGQLRGRAPRPRTVAWSSEPRRRDGLIARRNGAATEAWSAPAADDGAARENGGEKLAGLIATKLQQGYWVESQRDTDAVLASLGPHRWFGRVGPREENGREAVSVDAQGHTTIVRLPRRRY